MTFQPYLTSRPATHVPVPDEFWHSREWVDYVKQIVRLYSDTSAARTRLSSHDWDDFAQIATIHIWEKRALYNPAMPLGPWIKTVALRQVKNQIRKRVAHGTAPSAKLRYLFRNPARLITKTVTVTRGIEEIVYEPDAIDPSTEKQPVLPTLDDLGAINSRDREVLDRLLECNDMKTLATRECNVVTWRSNVLRRTYLRIALTRKRLQSRYRAALNLNA